MVQPFLILGSSSTELALVKLGFAIVAGLFGLLFWAFARNEQKKLWPRVARHLGLAFDGERIHGARDGATIEVALETRIVNKIQQTWTTLRLEHPALPSGLALRAAKDRLWGADDDLQTGDAAFDREVTIEGPDDWRMTLLSEAERVIVAAAIDGGWRLEGGALRLSLRGVATGKIEARVLEAETLVTILSERQDDPSRLAALARSGEVGARVAAFDRLDATYREHPETLALAHALRDDLAPAIALRAARVRVDLRRLATLALAADVAPEVRGLAIAELAGYPETSHAKKTIARLVADGPAPEIAAPVAGALGQVRHEDAEVTLVALLASASPETVAAAITSLATVGTIGAVAPLSALRSSRHGPRARAAIKAIQARAGNPDGGRLSLAAAQGGELALVPAR